MSHPQVHDHSNESNKLLLSFNKEQAKKPKKFYALIRLETSFLTFEDIDVLIPHS